MGFYPKIEMKWSKHMPWISSLCTAMVLKKYLTVFLLRGLLLCNANILWISMRNPWLFHLLSIGCLHFPKTTCPVRNAVGDLLHRVPANYAICQRTSWLRLLERQNPRRVTKKIFLLSWQRCPFCSPDIAGLSFYHCHLTSHSIAPF